jgi:hypothetical protein
VQPRGAVLPLPARAAPRSLQRVGEVARAVAEQQLVQPAVVEGRRAPRPALGRRQLAQALQRAAVVVADEAAVEVFVDVARAGAGRAKTAAHSAARGRRTRARRGGVAQRRGQVHAPALGRRAQRLQVADDDGATC